MHGFGPDHWTWQKFRAEQLAQQQQALLDQLALNDAVKWHEQQSGLCIDGECVEIIETLEDKRSASHPLQHTPQ